MRPASSRAYRPKAAWVQPRLPSESGLAATGFVRYRPAMETTTESVAARLEKMDLADPDGATVRLGRLWRDAPVVLAFLRHFG